LQQLIG
jgi:hypothetical protein